jgi:hypothetical protein
MSLSRKYLMILVACLGLLALTACTRDVTTIVQNDPQPSSCFECHTDGNSQLLAIETQWSTSHHGLGATVFEGGSASCVRCHANEGFMQYVNGEVPAGVPVPTSIHCFTCHAPHSSENFNLRVTEATALLNGDSYNIGAGNTCVVCHQARRDVAVYVTASNNISSRYGPHHGPQGDLLFGSNGYEYEDYDYGDTPQHRTLTSGGCVECHVGTVRIDEGFMLGGHTFNMTAEFDETTHYNTQACVRCHAIGDNFDYNGVQTEIDGLLAELQVLLVAAGFVDANGTPISFTGRPANDAGAIWNFMYIGREDRSHGVHNPAYARDLLQSTIDYMEGRPVS